MRNMYYLTEKKLIAFIGICGLLWLPETAYSEQSLLEVGPAIPPQEFFALGNVPGEIALEESFLEQPPSDQNIFFEDLFHLRGAQVADEALRSRFILSKRIESQIFKPGATFRISSKGNVQEYLNRAPQKEERFPLDPEALFEQQLSWGFETAQATVELLNSTALPLVGNLLSGVLEVGQSFEQADRRLKKRHLHLRYSDGGPTASYRLKY